jgi:hypothetical protein
MRTQTLIVTGTENGGRSVPPAKQQALECDLSRKLAVSPFESFTHFAARRGHSSGLVRGLFVRHEECLSSLRGLLSSYQYSLAPRGRRRTSPRS